MSETILNYPTDLTDEERELLAPMLPPPKSGNGNPGRPAADLRTVINGMLYVNKGGCQWRMMPKNFGSWSTVYGYFNRWSASGVWKKIMDALRRKERKRQGRKEDASGACADSQSVKTATQSEDTGFDGGKQVKGRKRHILTDTLGLILCVIVTAANTGDREGLMRLLSHYFLDRINRLRRIWADGGYSGAGIAGWVRGLKAAYKTVLDVVENKSKGFNIVKKRWVVERTFAWLLIFRRHSKDYEVLTRNSEAMIQISMIQILLKRLA